jgi:hypothetical protein
VVLAEKKAKRMTASIAKRLVRGEGGGGISVGSGRVNLSRFTGFCNRRLRPICNPDYWEFPFGGKGLKSSLVIFCASYG